MAEKKLFTEINPTDISIQSEDGGGIQFNQQGKFIFGAKNSATEESLNRVTDINPNDQSYIAIMNEESTNININIGNTNQYSLFTPNEDNILTTTLQNTNCGGEGINNLEFNETIKYIYSLINSNNPENFLYIPYTYDDFSESLSTYIKEFYTRFYNNTVEYYIGSTKTTKADSSKYNRFFTAPNGSIVEDNLFKTIYLPGGLRSIITALLPTSIIGTINYSLDRYYLILATANTFQNDVGFPYGVTTETMYKNLGSMTNYTQQEIVRAYNKDYNQIIEIYNNNPESFLTTFFSLLKKANESSSKYFTDAEAVKSWEDIKRRNNLTSNLPLGPVSGEKTEYGEYFYAKDGEAVLDRENKALIELEAIAKKYMMCREFTLKSDQQPTEKPTTTSTQQPTSTSQPTTSNADELEGIYEANFLPEEETQAKTDEIEVTDTSVFNESYDPELITSLSSNTNVIRSNQGNNTSSRYQYTGKKISLNQIDVYNGDNTPFLRQLNNWGCLVTSITMIAQAYGLNNIILDKFYTTASPYSRKSPYVDSNNNFLLSVFKKDYSQITRESGKIRDSQDQSAEGIVFEKYKSKIRSLKKPIIIRIVGYSSPGRGHYVVAVGITKDGNIIVHNPANSTVADKDTVITVDKMMGQGVANNGLNYDVLWFQ